MLLFRIENEYQFSTLLLHIVLPSDYQILVLWVPFQGQETIIITEKINIALLVLPIVSEIFWIESFGDQFGSAYRGKTGPVVPLQQFSVDLQLPVHTQIELLVLLTVFILVYGFAFCRAEYLIGSPLYRRFANGASFIISHL